VRSGYSKGDLGEARVALAVQGEAIGKNGDPIYATVPWSLKSAGIDVSNALIAAEGQPLLDNILAHLSEA
jgi:hypothetical protein